MSRDDRPKASEVFAKTTFVFSDKVGLAKAFPEIKSLRVSVRETGHVRYDSEATYHYTETTAGEYVDCSNALCYNGGFSLGAHLREMVREKKTEAEFSDLCRGNEGSPKGRRIYRKCMNFFRTKITIEYQTPDAAEPDANSRSRT